MKTIRLSKYILMLFLCCVNLPLIGQNMNDSIGDNTEIDSLVVTPKRDSTFYFKQNYYDFGETYQASGKESFDDMRVPRSGVASMVDVERVALDGSKYVDQIPYTHSVTSTGGKSYAIPIMTAASNGIVPQLSITYNSQSGNGVAGMGWSLSGLSSISVANKNLYYDGTVSAPRSGTRDIAFALDGVRLVPSVKMAEYPLETTQGQILVKPVYLTSSSSNVAYFEVLYPNGVKAKYGLSNKATYTYPVVSMEDMKGYRVDFEYESNYGDGYYFIGCPVRCSRF